jgi:hypothetical protein
MNSGEGRISGYPFMVVGSLFGIKMEEEAVDTKTSRHSLKKKQVYQGRERQDLLSQ